MVKLLAMQVTISNRRGAFMNRFAITSAITAVAAAIASPALAAVKQSAVVQPLPFVIDNVPAVPEPATWATMIIGFAVVGIAMRVRKTVRAKA
jgi:hypothetical protein